MNTIARRISIFAFIFSLAGMVCAQENVIDKYFSDYAKDASLTHVKVGEKTFSSFSDVKAKSGKEQDVLNALAQLKGIKGMFKDGTEENSEDALEMYQAGLEKLADDEAYEELMSMRNDEENGIMMIRERENGNQAEIEELMLMFSSGMEFGIITIYGTIDLQQITNLADVLRTNGEEWFELFEDTDMESIVFKPGADLEGIRTAAAAAANMGQGLELTVFPNPATDHVMLKSNKEKEGVYNLSFYSALGKELSTQKNVRLPYRMELSNFPEGTYFIKITNERGEHKSFKIVKP